MSKLTQCVQVIAILSPNRLQPIRADWQDLVALLQNSQQDLISPSVTEIIEPLVDSPKLDR